MPLIYPGIQQRLLLFGATYKTKTKSYEYKCNSLSMDKLLVSLKSTKY